MATMSQSLRDRLRAALGDTHTTELEASLDSVTDVSISYGLEVKLRSWLANDIFGIELVSILEHNLASCSDELERALASALGDQEASDDLVVLLNAIEGSPNSPSATPSATPSGSGV